MTHVASSLLAISEAATCNVPVPAGAASDHIAVVGIYKETTSAITTVPTGFTNKAALVTSADSRGSLHVYWKRLIAADSGTWNFGWTGSAWRSAVAGLWSGRITSGDPFDGTVGTGESTTTVNVLNVATTPGSAGGDAVGMWTNFAGGNSWTPPTNYTERRDNDTTSLHTRDNVAAGTTGSVTATADVSGFMKAFLGVLSASVASTSDTVKREKQARLGALMQM
jgi:hypothetical protein